MNVIRNWLTAERILPEHQDLEIRQVYVWNWTTDDKIVLVSKNGTSWQFPGGHPETGESIDKAARREMWEEAGLDIGELETTFFGYYVITEADENETQTYLQVRLKLSLGKSSSELDLQTHEVEGDNDSIKFVEAVTLEEATSRISWLSSTDEYKTVVTELNQ